MTNERHTDERQPYCAPSIAGRDKIEALAVDSSLSDSKPPPCCV
jgi:hypothetical protein